MCFALAAVFHSLSHNSRVSAAFTYDVTIDDHITFNLHYSRESESIAGELRDSQLLYSLGTALFVIGTIAISSGEWSRAVISGAVAGVIVLAIHKPITRKLMEHSIEKRVRRLYAASDFHSPCRHRLVLDENGITETSSTEETRFPWTSVRRVATTPSLVMIFVGPARAVLVPLSADHEDRTRLLDALTRLRADVP